MKLSVIITTYNSGEWLQKVLLGFTVQTEKEFKLISDFDNYFLILIILDYFC